MKNSILTLSIVLLSMTSFLFSQTNTVGTYSNKKENFTNVKFKLYDTKDRWIFIKLNTQNGMMWQVKFDIEEDNRFETNLNTLPLAEKNQEVNNRFTLYPTSNIYTFILMDQIDGRMWQVHWSEKSDERAIVRIE